jgi:hypothetical protein
VLGVGDEEAGISNSGTPVLTMQGTYRAPREWIDVLDGIARERWPEGFVRANRTTSYSTITRPAFRPCARTRSTI